MEETMIIESGWKHVLENTIVKNVKTRAGNESQNDIAHTIFRIVHNDNLNHCELYHITLQYGDHWEFYLETNWMKNKKVLTTCKGALESKLLLKYSKTKHERM